MFYIFDIKSKVFDKHYLNIRFSKDINNAMTFGMIECFYLRAPITKEEMEKVLIGVYDSDDDSKEYFDAYRLVDIVLKLGIEIKGVVLHSNHSMTSKSINNIFRIDINKSIENPDKDLIKEITKGKLLNNSYINESRYLISYRRDMIKDRVLYIPSNVVDIMPDIERQVFDNEFDTIFIPKSIRLSNSTARILNSIRISGLTDIRKGGFIFDGDVDLLGDTLIALNARNYYSSGVINLNRYSINVLLNNIVRLDNDRLLTIRDSKRTVVVNLKTDKIVIKES